MNSVKPQVPGNLIAVDDFYDYARDFVLEESTIKQIKCCDEKNENADYYKLEVQKSVFNNGSFLHCDFENASFVDVVFESCDLSNSCFACAYFERCHFISCKCVGVNFREAVFKNTTFEDANLQYSNFNKSRITDMLLDEADLTEASVSEVKLNRFRAVNTKFVKTNFFKTPLKTVDFTQNELIAPFVSTPPDELRGAVIDMLQAAELIELWGIVVKR